MKKHKNGKVVLYNTTVKLNVKINGKPNSVTLRRDLVSLWYFLRDEEGEVRSAIQDFVQNKVVERWNKKNGRKFSEFASLCMIRSIMERKDFYQFKKIYDKCD